MHEILTILFSLDYLLKNNYIFIIYCYIIVYANKVSGSTW